MVIRKNDWQSLKPKASEDGDFWLWWSVMDGVFQGAVEGAAHEASTMYERSVVGDEVGTRPGELGLEEVGENVYEADRNEQEDNEDQDDEDEYQDGDNDGDIDIDDFGI